MARRLALLLTIAAGCGGPTATAPPPAPKPVAEVEAPKPVARWQLGVASTFPLGRALKLGSVSLIPAAHGERWITRENGSIVNAPTILDGDLVAALRAHAGIDLVTASGDVLTIPTPEGEVVAVTRAPRPFVRAAADDVAIVAVGPHGTLERSTDRGKTWSALDVAKFGRPSDVAMDRSGHALALVVPEGLIGSVDHGATWARLPLTMPTPERVSVADDGLVYVGSPASGARWDGGKLLPPENAEAGRKWLDRPIEGPIVASAMGAHALLDVVLVGDKLRYAVTPLGGARAWRDVDARCERVDASAYEDVFSFSCVDSVGKARDFTSLDGGASFVESAPRPSDLREAVARYLVGPKGAAFVVSRSNVWSVRASSDRPFREVGLPVQLLAATVDATRSRFVLLLNDFGKVRFAVLPFDAVEPSMLAGTTPISYLPQRERMTIAAHGDTFVGTISGAKEISIFRSRDAGATMEASAVLLPGATVSLFADRGLIESQGRLYETYDFASNYRPAGLSPGLPIACGEAGCGAGFAMRLGWDHPNRPELPIAAKPVPAPPTKTAPRDLECKTAAKIGPTVGTFDVRAYEGDIGLRWFGEHEVVEGTEDKPAAKVTTLLAKGSTKEQIVFHALPNGIVAVRYSIPPKGSVPGLRPVSMEIAWRRTGDAKIRKAKLGEVGSFRVAVGSTQLAERRWPWIVGIVDDGVLVQPTHPKAYQPMIGRASPYEDKDPIRYVHDDGKIELLEAPEPIDIARVITKTAGGFLIVAREPSDDGTVSLETSSDGKTWKHRAIRLWMPAEGDSPGFWYADEGKYDESVGFGFTIVAGVPTWSIAPNDGSYAYLAALGASGLDVTAAKIADEPCGDEPGAVRMPYPLAGGGFRYGAAVLRRGVLRFSTKSGTTCLRAIGGEDSEGYPVVISLTDHAWLAKKHELHPMTCTLK